MSRDPETKRCTCCGALGDCACAGDCEPGQHDTQVAPLLIALHQAVVAAKAARSRGFRR